jgi:hypothetical protein
VRSSTRFNEQEAADYLGGIPVSTLRYWRTVGGGPVFIKIGHRVRYDTRDLDDYLASRRRESTSSGGPGDHPTVRQEGDL